MKNVLYLATKVLQFYAVVRLVCYLKVVKAGLKRPCKGFVSKYIKLIEFSPLTLFHVSFKTGFHDKFPDYVLETKKCGHSMVCTIDCRCLHLIFDLCSLTLMKMVMKTLTLTSIFQIVSTLVSGFFSEVPLEP